MDVVKSEDILLRLHTKLLQQLCICDCCALSRCWSLRPLAMLLTASQNVLQQVKAGEMAWNGRPS